MKVVSILPQHKERNMLLKMVYVLLERMSVFRYGRIELNFFISEQEYLVCMYILSWTGATHCLTVRRFHCI